MRNFLTLFVLALPFIVCAQVQQNDIDGREINVSIQTSANTISPIFSFEFEKVGNELPTRARLFSFLPERPFQPFPFSGIKPKPATIIYVPEYTQGKFCDFEDYINRKNKIRIDFSVK